MKSAHVAILITFIILGCDEDRIKEKPDEIIPSKPCATLYSNIMEMLVENKNNQMLHKILFSDTIEKKILLTKETEVFITYISEGAGYANSLGWYSYPENSAPATSSGIKKNLLFPHISSAVLTQGDMLKVGNGKFPAGTVIGFFLVIKGWENGRVNYDKPTFFTNWNWNINNYQQHILFRENECTDIVVAFEDKTIEEGSDLDYNDIIFTIADNSQQLQTTSIKLQKVPDL